MHWVPDSKHIYKYIQTVYTVSLAAIEGIFKTKF